MKDIEQLLRQKWRVITDRCKHNKYYKGRVLNEFESYDEFKKWSLMNGWKRGFVIHRKDRNGNYNKDNCEYLSPEEHRKITGQERRKFTPEEVVEIRNKYSTGKTSKALGNEYGYSQRGIIQIVNRETYTDVK